jgi:putative Holliday junction resolvase
MDKLLAIDYGEKKIGLAIGDSETKIASPFRILVNNKELMDKLKEICRKEEIDKIVIGLPVGLKGTNTEQTKLVLNFIEKVKKSLGLEVIEQDEKFSSMYAQKLLRETKAKHLDDDVAAMIVLQSHLDEVRRPKAEV